MAQTNTAKTPANHNGGVILKEAPELPSAPRPQLLQLPLSPMKTGNNRRDRALASPGMQPTPKQLHAV
jgi:hypothetical protein